jgi:hypothetical protein
MIRDSEASLGEMAEYFGPEMADVVALVSEPMMGVGGEARYCLMALRCHALFERVDRAEDASA